MSKVDRARCSGCRDWFAPAELTNSLCNECRLAAENAALKDENFRLRMAAQAIRLNLCDGKLITQGDGVTVNWHIPDQLLEHLRDSPAVQHAIVTNSTWRRKALDNG